MKKCLKCGRIFEDNSVFCSSCGEKLVASNTCPRCGAEVQENDQFCSQCGLNLKTRNVCHKCGAEIKDGSKFCPSCGEPLSSNQIVTNKRGHNSNQSSQKMDSKKWINIIYVSLFAIISLLMIVGIFGNIATASALGEKSSLSIKYFFGEGAKELRALETAYEYDYYYRYNLTIFILQNIFYFGGILSLLIVIGIGIYKSVKSINEGFPLSRRYFYLLLLSVLPHIMFTAFTTMANTNITVKIIFGWGTTLLVIASLVSVLVYCSNNIIEGIIEKKNYISRSFLSGAFIFMTVIAIWGTTKQIAIKSSGIYVDFPSSALLNLIFMEASLNGDYTITNAAFSLSVSSFVFSLFVIGLLPLTLSSLTSNKKSYNVSGLVFSLLIFVFSLLSGIVGASSVEEGTAKYLGSIAGLGSGTVIAMIFSLLSAVLIILGFAFKPKAHD